MRAVPILLVSTLVVAACGGDPTGPGPVPVACDEAEPVALAVGASAVLDASGAAACTRLPGAGAEAEYLYVALLGQGNETDDGVQAVFRLAGESAEVTPTTRRAPVPSPMLSAFHPRRSAAEFHAMLRERERALAASPAAALVQPNVGRAAAVPPVVGERRTFKVCRTTECNAFDEAAATARFVGEKVAIYLDDRDFEQPGGYTQADLDNVGALFDDFLYPIDTTAFGREPDIDNNGVVVVLLSREVNQLSGTCADGSIILGYFFSLDLLPSLPNSNAGEVFYGLVPDPNNPGCGVDLEFASEILPPTFIHEFQHMISFNQHVLVRGGFSEDTWLNEGLSHFAEELAGRKVPNERCAPSGSGQPDCLTQFGFANLRNAYDYLLDPELHYLVEPASSGGTLEERGANWLFVRWLADHFGDDEFGTSLTRALVRSNRTGGDNVQAATGQPFAQLAAEWHLANYLDDLPAFTPQNPRLRYESWNLRSTYASLHQQLPTIFPREYPLVPGVAVNGDYLRTGTLLGGSGHYVRITQTAGAGEVTFRLTDANGRSLPAAVAPRIALVRVR